MSASDVNKAQLAAHWESGNETKIPVLGVDYNDTDVATSFYTACENRLSEHAPCYENGTKRAGHERTWQCLLGNDTDATNQRVATNWLRGQLTPDLQTLLTHRMNVLPHFTDTKTSDEAFKLFQLLVGSRIQRNTDPQALLEERTLHIILDHPPGEALQYTVNTDTPVLTMLYARNLAAIMDGKHRHNAKNFSRSDPLRWDLEFAYLARGISGPTSKIHKQLHSIKHYADPDKPTRTEVYNVLEQYDRREFSTEGSSHEGYVKPSLNEPVAHLAARPTLKRPHKPTGATPTRGAPARPTLKVAIKPEKAAAKPTDTGKKVRHCNKLHKFGQCDGENGECTKKGYEHPKHLVICDTVAKGVPCTIFRGDQPCWRCHDKSVAAARLAAYEEWEKVSSNVADAASDDESAPSAGFASMYQLPAVPLTKVHTPAELRTTTAAPVVPNDEVSAQAARIARLEAQLERVLAAPPPAAPAPVAPATSSMATSPPPPDVLNKTPPTPPTNRNLSSAFTAQFTDGPPTSKDVDYEEDLLDDGESAANDKLAEDTSAWVNVARRGAQKVSTFLRAFRASHKTLTPPSLETAKWCLDTGCTHNLTPYLDDLTTPRANPRAIQGIGNAPRATHSGTIKCIGDNSVFPLSGVAYHLPTLKNRLFSVSKALRAGFSLLLQPPSPNSSLAGYLSHPTHGKFNVTLTQDLFYFELPVDSPFVSALLSESSPQPEKTPLHPTLAPSIPAPSTPSRPRLTRHVVFNTVPAPPTPSPKTPNKSIPKSILKPPHTAPPAPSDTPVAPPTTETAAPTVAPVFSAISHRKTLNHLRWGHISDTKLDSTLKVVDGALPSTGESRDPCDSCLAGTAKHKPLPSDREHATPRPPNTRLSYTDLWGPFPIRGTNGQNYLQGFIDDDSGHVICYATAGKSHTAAAIKQYQAEMFLLTGHQPAVEQLQSDSEAVFTSGKTPAACNELGIFQRFSAPYTQGQNGKIERFWATMQARVTSMLHYSQVPPKFWPFAVTAMVHAHNRTAATHGLTPFEKLTNRRPNVSLLRTWGCPVQTLLEKGDRPTKFHSKIRSGINLGPANQYKNAFHIWFPETNEIKPVYHIPSTGFDELWRERAKYYASLKLANEPFAAPQLALVPQDTTPTPNPKQAASPPHAPPPRHPTLTPRPPPPTTRPHPPTRPHLTPQPPASPLLTPFGAPRLTAPNPRRELNPRRLELSPVPETAPPPSPEPTPTPEASTNHTIPRDPNQRRSARFAPTRVDSPPPRTSVPIVPENDSDIYISQIVRKAYIPSGKDAYIVRYAPTPNITQEAIDARTQQHVPPTTRASRLEQVSGNHPFVLEHKAPDPSNPGNFIATWSEGPELRSSLCSADGTPGPLLASHERSSGPSAAHAHPHKIIKSGLTPDSRTQALHSADRRHWRFAMDAEHDQLWSADTWELVPRTSARNVITGKWVLKIKRDKDGKIDRYKARWVARGFSQRHGVDFNEVFAPVVRYSSLRKLLSIANRKNMEAYGLDVSNAFARAEVDEDLYVEQPHGYEQTGPNGEPLVCKLKKGLYGTKQAARLWHHTFRKHLLDDGWVPYECDPCIFSRNTSKYGLEFLGIYVDDCVHLCKSLTAHKSLEKYMNLKFPTTSQEPLNWILNCRVTRDRTNKTLWLDQHQSIKDFLSKWDIATPSRAPTAPMRDSWQYGTEAPIDPVENKHKMTEYRSKVSSLSYFVQVTRPDLAFSVNSLARWMHAPNAACFQALDDVCSYLSTHTDLGLCYRATNKPVRTYAFADASWAGPDSIKAKSTTGNLIFYGNDLIDWTSALQKTPALSPAEHYISRNQIECSM